MFFVGVGQQAQAIRQPLINRLSGKNPKSRRNDPPSFLIHHRPGLRSGEKEGGYVIAQITIFPWLVFLLISSSRLSLLTHPYRRETWFFNQFTFSFMPFFCDIQLLLIIKAKKIQKLVALGYGKPVRSKSHSLFNQNYSGVRLGKKAKKDLTGCGKPVRSKLQFCHTWREDSAQTSQVFNN